MSPSFTRAYPFVMDHGQGCWATDVDGNVFLDFTAGIAVNTTGHSHPRVVEAIEKQARNFVHMSGTDFYYRSEIDLAERLEAKILPGIPARVFVEPIQGEGGYLVPPDDFLPRLRELTHKHGILLVADEVQSGMGRTGHLLAVEHWGVEPDIVCLAKGIASGLPLGAFIARAEQMSWPPGSHGSTFGGNPVACAAGLATLDLLESGLMENAATVGAVMQDGLREIASTHKDVTDVRGLGLMLAIELRTPELAAKLVQSAFERGLQIGRASCRERL